MAWISSEYTQESTSVGTAATVVFQKQFGRRDVQGDVTIINDDSSSSALTGYLIQRKSHSSDDWTDWLEDADFNTVSNLLLHVSDNKPHSLAASSRCTVTLNRKNTYAERHLAVSDDNSSVTIYDVSGHE